MLMLCACCLFICTPKKNTHTHTRTHAYFTRLFWRYNNLADPRCRFFNWCDYAHLHQPVKFIFHFFRIDIGTRLLASTTGCTSGLSRSCCVRGILPNFPLNTVVNTSSFVFTEAITSQLTYSIFISCICTLVLYPMIGCLSFSHTTNEYFFPFFGFRTVILHIPAGL